MLAWPVLPGEKQGVAGSVASSIQIGYGLTKKGGSNPIIRDAAISFLKYLHSEDRTMQRLRKYAIIAPIINNYHIIESCLAGTPNNALSAGLKNIVAGETTPEEVAAEVERLMKR